MVLDVEVDHAARPPPRAPPGTAAASRLSASVVLRVKITTSSSRAPTKPADLGPGGLVGAGADRRGVPGAAMHAGVERQQLGHLIGDGAQRRGAGGVVQVDVPGGSAVHERDRQVRADDLGQRRHRCNRAWRRRGGGSGARGRRGTAEQQESTFVVSGTAQDPIDAGPRLPVPAGNGPRPHPGHPCGRGLPASEPGLDAGTLDAGRKAIRTPRPRRATHRSGASGAEPGEARDRSKCSRLLTFHATGLRTSADPPSARPWPIRGPRLAR